MVFCSVRERESGTAPGGGEGGDVLRGGFSSHKTETAKAGLFYPRRETERIVLRAAEQGGCSAWGVAFVDWDVVKEAREPWNVSNWLMMGCGCYQNARTVECGFHDWHQLSMYTVQRSNQAVLFSRRHGFLDGNSIFGSNHSLTRNTPIN